MSNWFRMGRPAVVLAAGAAALGALTLGLAGAGASRAQAPAAAPPAQAEPPSEMAMAIGQRLYASHCAQCHDDATGRAPPKVDIAAHTPDEVVGILTNGPMKPMAAGLSADDIQALASYLTGKSPTAAKSSAPAMPVPTRDNNPCADAAPPIHLGGAQWNGWGRDLENTRYQPEPGLTAADVGRLKVKWAFAYPGGHNGQATLIGGRLYFTAASGRIYSLNAATGCVYWRHDAPDGVRTSPVIGPVAKGASPSGYGLFYGDAKASVGALDASSGKLLWTTRVDDDPRALITGSPVLYKGRLYVPVSSLEEGASQDKTYGCCRFRGSVVALDAATGKVLWQTYPIDHAPAPFKVNSAGVQMYGPAGGAIWSAPTIDAKRGLLYAATGDSYTDVDTKGADAVVALSLTTGKIVWINQVTRADNFLVGCGRKPNPANCPDTLGPDFDFGASPILSDLGGGRQMLMAGQKSGIVYGLDPDHGGKLVWQIKIGHGSALGGVEWGMAADPHALYAAISDVAVAPGQGVPGLTALTKGEGKRLWHVDAPKPVCNMAGRCSNAYSAAVTAIPGVVLAGAKDGHLRAYASKTGALLWDFDTAGAPYQPVNIAGQVKGGVIDATGATVANGMVYQHSGYGGFGQANAGMVVLLAFSVDGK